MFAPWDDAPLLVQRAYTWSTQRLTQVVFVLMTGLKHGVKTTTSADLGADGSDGHSITSAVRQQLTQSPKIPAPSTS